MKKIIWSLFDSETAITKKLESEKYKVFTIGLASDSSMTNDFINIDLSKKRCIKKLSKLPKPDIIFASPPCETWVNVSVGSVRLFDRNYKEYNLYWQKNFKPNDFTKEHRNRRLMGQKTAYWTAKIIKGFNPDLWVVENGASSLIFEYLYNYHALKGHQNRCRYSAYCNREFSEKPTIFYSNRQMMLKNNKVKSNKRISANAKSNPKIIPGYVQVTTYAERSKVPLEVYQDILKHYEGKGQKTLFS